MNWYGLIHSAGVKNAGNVVRLSDFHPAGTPTGPVRAATPPAQLLRFPLSRRSAHAASLPPETVTAWRTPVDHSAGDFLSTRAVGQSRTHPARAESIAARIAEITPTAPAAGLNSRSCRPSSAAAVTSEPPHTRPTMSAVDADGEPSCLEKSGRLLARSISSFHSDAITKVRADTSPHVGSVVGSAPGRRFFPEAEAERLALGLPHHRRHPMTADEALAGIITVLVCGAALIYLIARSL